MSRLRSIIGAALVALAIQPGDAPASPPVDSILWGAWIGDQFTGTEAPWDWNAVTQFETRAAGGKRVSLLNFSSSFDNCGGPCPFPTGVMQSIRDHGAMPFFSWGTAGIPADELTRGRWDSYIRSFAQGAARWGHPLLLRFNWEMNGDWFTWGRYTASQQVAVWRRVHDIFVEQGATEVRWVWCPNVDPYGSLAPLAPRYPGNAYVDWTCADGYNTTAPAMSWADMFGSVEFAARTLSGGKPFVVGEVGASNAHRDKAAWIAEMFRAIDQGRYPYLRGLLWFDKHESGPGGVADWPVEALPAASQAFAQGIAGNAFSANAHGSAASAVANAVAANVDASEPAPERRRRPDRSRRRWRGR